MTDQDKSYARERELIEALRLDEVIRTFINRWAPSSIDGPRDFEADFIHVVQRIYQEAQRPYVKAFADAMALQPIQVFVPQDALSQKETQP